MNERIKEILEDLGFETREINIYLTLIKNQSLTALQLSKETRIDRTTIYDILERLIDKGIVSFTIKNKTKHFSTLKPEELLIHFKEKYSSLENILPELNKLLNKKEEKVKSELFQGREGLKIVLKSLINSGENYKVIGITNEYENILGYFNEQGAIRLDQWKVKEKAIVSRNAKFKKLKCGIYRYLDKKLIPPVTTLIYGNKVVFFIWTEPYFAISIENNTLVKAQEEYFDLLWSIAKKS